MRTLTRGAGYALIDNRAAGEGKQEFDVLTCPHCQTVINLQNWRRHDGQSGWCANCKAPICGHCATRMLFEGCIPFLKKIETILAKEHREVQFRKLAGLDPEPPASVFRPGLGPETKP